MGIEHAMALIAERRIQEAMEEGRFDRLPGRGQPQRLEDLSNLPPEARLAYMILKNSGFMKGEAGDRPGLDIMLELLKKP